MTLGGFPGGIMAVYVDGRSIGSVNFYAGTTGFNYIATIDFLIDEPGLHEIVWVVVSTSGSGYRVFVTEYWINRIGR